MCIHHIFLAVVWNNSMINLWSRIPKLKDFFSPNISDTEDTLEAFWDLHVRVNLQFFFTPKISTIAGRGSLL
jgi:hypothetical protein